MKTPLVPKLCWVDPWVPLLGFKILKEEAEIGSQMIS